MKIAIIGLGVIGGSLGLAVRQNRPGVVVTGHDTPESMRSALRLGAVDEAAHSVAAAVRDADIIFVCTPVRTIMALLPEIGRNAKPGAVITDVGSTKGEIVAAARRVLPKNVLFIGGHPMAGSEGKGIAAADALLFQNAVYVLCAAAGERRKIGRLTALLRSIGARVLFLSADRHDAVAASISHLPQLIAVAMMTMAARRNRKEPATLQLAAGGFRDITRIASSPYGMWRDILGTNPRTIAAVLKEFTAVLKQYERSLRSGNGDAAFAAAFLQAKTLRDAIPKNSKGFLHPLHEVLVSVEDKPGILSMMTAALTNAGINIKDIELLKIRDGRGGTFRLSFESRTDARRAHTVIRSARFTTLSSR